MATANSPLDVINKYINSEEGDFDQAIPQLTTTQLLVLSFELPIDLQDLRFQVNSISERTATHGAHASDSAMSNAYRNKAARIRAVLTVLAVVLGDRIDRKNGKDVADV